MAPALTDSHFFTLSNTMEKARDIHDLQSTLEILRKALSILWDFQTMMLSLQIF